MTPRLCRHDAGTSPQFTCHFGAVHTVDPAGWLGIPQHKLREEFIPSFFRHGCVRHLLPLYEIVECDAQLSWRAVLGLLSCIEPFLSGPETRPTRDVIGNINFFPLWMAAGTLKFRNSPKELVHELSYSIVTLGIMRPIIHDE